jgi:hypothetical protein
MRTPLHIKPASFDVQQRTEASAAAADLGQGLVMELHSFTTSFFADPDVPVGKIAVYAPTQYGSSPTYVKTLDGPADRYDPWEKR